jgi:ABC-type lipoprotein export system ATPase subunit
VVTHDARLTRFADAVISIEDGRLHDAERPQSKKQWRTAS